MIGIAIVIIAWIVYTIAVRLKRKFMDRVTFVHKTVWITGASSGIGEALTYEFNKLGATVIISARRREELEKVKNRSKFPDKVIVHTLDMSEPESTEQAAQKFLAQNKDITIDILINNAGASMRISFIENDLSNDIKLMNLNFVSQIALTRPVVQKMVESGGGQIVNISSVQAKVAPPNRTTYAASKSAIMGYFDALRAELYGNNIRVTNILPGYVKTNLSQAALGKDGKAHGKMDATTESGMPAEKFATLAANAIYFKENEVVITNKILHRIAIFFRTIWPEGVFLYLQKIQAKESKQTKANTSKKDE